MLEKPSLSDQSIIDYLKNHYNIHAQLLIFLPLGADMNSFVYRVDAKDGLSYFVKLKQGHQHQIGIEIVELLSH